MAGSPVKDGPGGLNWRTENSRFLKAIGKVEQSNAPRQLLAHCGNLLVAWSDESRCLIAVDIGSDRNDDRYYVSVHKCHFNRIQCN